MDCLMSAAQLVLSVEVWISLTTVERESSFFFLCPMLDCGRGVDFLSDLSGEVMTWTVCHIEIYLKRLCNAGAGKDQQQTPFQNVV